VHLQRLMLPRKIEKLRHRRIDMFEPISKYEPRNTILLKDHPVYKSTIFLKRWMIWLETWYLSFKINLLLTSNYQDLIGVIEHLLHQLV